MKKKLTITLITIILIVIIYILFFKENNTGSNIDGQKMTNNVSSYSVKTSMRNSMPGEDIFIYDENDKLVLSLNNENQPQYLYALYENYIILDSGTSASQREMIVYNIPSGKEIYRTDYYPGENGLVLDNNNITFHKKIEQSFYGNYTLPECEDEYDKGYIESYVYSIGEDQANDLGDIQCTYFE